MPSLTFGIDVVLHVPDGAEGLLQVRVASDFRLLPAPVQIGRQSRETRHSPERRAATCPASMAPSLFNAVTMPLAPLHEVCSGVQNAHFRKISRSRQLSQTTHTHVRMSKHIKHQRNSGTRCFVTHLMPFLPPPPTNNKQTGGER